MRSGDSRDRIRVVHVLRDDHAAHVGGDIAELRGMTDGLRRHGVDAVAATLEDAPADVDVVHLYNLQLPKQLIHAEVEARRRWPRARIAITPIFATYPLREVAAVRERAIAETALRRVGMARLTWVPIRRALRRADLVLAKHRSEAELLARFYRLGSADQIRLLPNGVWVDEWASDRSPATRASVLSMHGIAADAHPVVASVARVEPNKNQLRLVRAVAMLPEAALLLVGPADEEYGDRVRSLAAQLLPGRFAWLDRQPRPVVKQMLGAADVHALPSFLEVQSTVAIEAAVAGCEVVTARSPAVEEVWGDLVHGCAPHSPPSIATAIQRAVDAPHQPALAVRAAEFDFDRLGARAAAIYRDLLG